MEASLQFICKKATMKKTRQTTLRCAFLALALTAACPIFAQPTTTTATMPPRALKVVIITMFAPEAEPWIAPLQSKEEITVADFSPDYPAIQCSVDGAC
jgi:purine nucleoside permease